MKHLRAFAMAAVAAVTSFLAPAPARALDCDQQAAGLMLCLPRFGTDGDHWGQATINAFDILNDSVPVLGAGTTNYMGRLLVNEIGAQRSSYGIAFTSVTTAYSSMSVVAPEGLRVRYRVDAGSLTVSDFGVFSGSFTVNGSGLSNRYGIATATITATGLIEADEYTEGGSNTLTNDISGNSATATALAANGANSASGYVCRGVDASGVCEEAVVDASAVDSSTSPVASNALFDHAAFTGSSAHGAVSANTASQIVARDGSGNFSAGTITAELTGNAATATALAANGANCSAGNYPLGVDASGAVESCTAVAGGGDAVLASTQTFSGTNTFTSTIASRGSIIHGSPTAGAGVNDALQLIWAKSVDGATQSSGCVVAMTMSSAGNSATETAFLQFTSTTTSALNSALGVLHEQCVPGAVCRVAVGGLVRVRAEAGIALGNCVRTTSANRCHMGDTADHSATAGCKGYAMSTTNGAGQWAWILMGWK